MIFCTAVNCMDGRVQMPVIKYLKDRFKVEYVDMITEPGPNGILAKQKNPDRVQSILDRINVSVNEHGSRQIAVIGHFDCAGNPGGKEEQKEDTLNAVKFLKKKIAGPEVIGLWVNENREVEEAE